MKKNITWSCVPPRRGKYQILPLIAALSLVLQSRAVDFLYFTERADPWPGQSRMMRVKTDGTGLETVLIGDGNEGGIALDVPHSHLYSGSEIGLYRANLDGTGRVNLVPAVNPVQDVELDLVHGKVYWSEGGQGRNSIRCANLDGTDVQTLIDVGFDGFFPGLAVDPYAGKLYFNYDTGFNDTLQVMNLDGSGQAVLYNLSTPGGLAYDLEIDTTTGTLFFNFVGSPDPGIYKASVDGIAPLELVIPTPDGVANGLHYDSLHQKFYSTYQAAFGNEIRSVDLDGTGVRTMAQYSGVLSWYEVGHNITVPDTEPPSIACPADMTLPCSVERLIPLSYPQAIVSDNLDPAPTVTYSIPSGSEVPVGTTTVTAGATDASGNSSACSFTVTRAPLGFAGFLSPVGGADASGGSFDDPLRTFKLKSTIPLRFTASCGGSPVLEAIHTLQVVKWSSQTDSDLPIDATPTDAATSGNQFRLVGNEWHFNLDTKATGMTIGKWQFTVTLSDGSQHSAWIQLK